ncbi:VOC family protein [Bordetella genomosp. 12]|uniref:VOC family protein n=1 Tax=Bordetella genomosp. 12 TaxID=463035 RepID=UPI0026AFD3F1
MSKQQSLPLQGVHHTARPTWKLAETVHFYRDLLGLPLVHAISARGWGPDNHADFLHFFFDSGNHSTIAFFYYIGADQPDFAQPKPDYRYKATHTAWRVDTREQLLACRAKVEAAGIQLNYQIRHEVIESIYFFDPNGYSIEITWQARPFTQLDIDDAARTINAAVELSQQPGALTGIDAVWQRKAQLLAQELENV